MKSVDVEPKKRLSEYFLLFILQVWDAGDSVSLWCTVRICECLWALWLWDPGNL
jgi:hypothetical protein